MDLHDLVFERPWCEESVNDLVLLDRQGVEEDVFHRQDLPVFDQTAKLRARHPFFLFALAFAFALSFLAFAFTLAFVAEASTLAEASFSHVCAYDSGLEQNNLEPK